MHPFTLERPRDLTAALAWRAQAGRTDAPTEYIAGGTDMVQLLQENVRRPERLVSLAGLLDNRIVGGPQGLRIGAAATMADVAAHPGVVEQFPVIAEALLNSASPLARRSHYLKVRDRASFEFALVSAAVALEMDGDRIRQARVALGGVGTKPWRAARVEAALAGASLEPEVLRSAAAVAAEGAQGYGHNDFKIELMQRVIVRAVQ